MNGELVKILNNHYPKFPMEPSLILMAYVGSIAHGTYVPSSDPNSIDDKDVMGIYVPPKSYYLGLDEWAPKQHQEGEWDIVLYSARKYIGLLLGCNPNVLSLLWSERNAYLKIEPEGQLLIDNRLIFLSKSRAYDAFCGYASGQLKRMTRLGDANKAYQGSRRREMFKKFGYDCKNASHLIRILRLGIELLTDGEIRVKRHDSSELIDIKQGKYSLEKVERMAEEHFKLAQEAHVRSKLPAKPDLEKANQLAVQIAEMRLAKYEEEAA